MGADEFFKKYPLPDNFQKGWIFNGVHSQTSSMNHERNEGDRFNWNAKTIANLRDEIEKLVILDFIIRNTDRGLDNWMLKLEYQNTDCAIGSLMEHSDPVIKLAAIDNGLSFPWKHPNEWRSFPYGWLYLPILIIGQPFSTKTRTHFLSLLCSTKWWEETTVLLKEVFSRDSGFKERMFKKQLAVLKGQAFNVVETLKNPQEGPLDLVRKRRVLISDQEVEIPVVSPFSTLIDSAQTPVIVEKIIRSHTRDPESGTNETKNHGENLEHVSVLANPASSVSMTGTLTGHSIPVLKSFAGNDISFSGNNIKNEAENGTVTDVILPQTNIDNHDHLNSNNFISDIAGNINYSSKSSNDRSNNSAHSAIGSTCYRDQYHPQKTVQHDTQWIRSRSVQLQKIWNQLVSGEIDESKFNEMMSNFNNQGTHDVKLEESDYHIDVSFKYDKNHHNHKDFSVTFSQDQRPGAFLYGDNANGQSTGERFIRSEIGTGPNTESDAVSIVPVSYTDDRRFKMKNCALGHFNNSNVDKNQNNLKSQHATQIEEPTIPAKRKNIAVGKEEEHQKEASNSDGLYSKVLSARRKQLPLHIPTNLNDANPANQIHTSPNEEHDDNNSKKLLLNCVQCVDDAVSRDDLGLSSKLKNKEHVAGDLHSSVKRSANACFGTTISEQGGRRKVDDDNFDNADVPNENSDNIGRS
ncbi:unnamed protein product [Ambrosiozyma monospora]|uniref:Phosphatidylinositol 4-kinase n=1 Tax=Ambrosiozyma monospora TaxID=43982 RepID=A0A9W6Z361_AMBMO|nr:unnamed protein product [Ambrosiozyma monospora]